MIFLQQRSNLDKVKIVTPRGSNLSFQDESAHKLPQEETKRITTAGIPIRNFDRVNNLANVYKPTTARRDDFHTARSAMKFANPGK